MATIFERIIAGELPCHKVWEDDEHFAFLDIAPRVEGHTLVVPKRATDYLFDLDEEATARLWVAARAVAEHLRERLSCKRVCVAVLGYEVPHCHVHLLPTNDLHDFPFPPVDAAAKAGLAETAKRLAL